MSSVVCIILAFCAVVSTNPIPATLQSHAYADNSDPAAGDIADLLHDIAERAQKNTKVSEIVAAAVSEVTKALKAAVVETEAQAAVRTALSQAAEAIEATAKDNGNDGGIILVVQKLTDAIKTTAAGTQASAELKSHVEKVLKAFQVAAESKNDAVAAVDIDKLGDAAEIVDAAANALFNEVEVAAKVRLAIKETADAIKAVAKQKENDAGITLAAQKVADAVGAVRAEAEAAEEIRSSLEKALDAVGSAADIIEDVMENAGATKATAEEGDAGAHEAHEDDEDDEDDETDQLADENDSATLALAVKNVAHAIKANAAAAVAAKDSNAGAELLVSGVIDAVKSAIGDKKVASETDADVSEADADVDARVDAEPSPARRPSHPGKDGERLYGSDSARTGKEDDKIHAKQHATAIAANANRGGGNIAANALNLANAGLNAGLAMGLGATNTGIKSVGSMLNGLGGHAANVARAAGRRGAGISFPL